MYLHPAGKARQFANDSKGWKALLGWLADCPVVRVVFEPTGRYHHDFERMLVKAGLSLAKVNPRQARRFAEAIGCNAKTDAVDAAMLARMGALLEPPARPIISPVLDDMKELQVARLGLIKDRTAAKNREHACRSSLLKRHAAQRLAQIDRQVAAIDAELKANLSRQPELMARFAVLSSIPGIGDLTAIAMLIDMPELGSIDSKQAASLAGLAPIARDSGKHRGKRHIRGGRAQLRRALYMPALVATRFNPDMKTKYTALVAAGKHPRWRSLPLCESSSSSPTLCSKPTENGRRSLLDHNGYSGCRSPPLTASRHVRDGCDPSGRDDGSNLRSRHCRVVHQTTDRRCATAESCQADSAMGSPPAAHRRLRRVPCANTNDDAARDHGVWAKTAQRSPTRHR